MNLWRINKYYFLKLKRLRGTPRALAGGTAIGVFIGLTPTMPLHTLFILLLAFATRTSALAGIIVSFMVCNPLTYLPIYYLAAALGNFATPYELNLEKVRMILEHVLNADTVKESLSIIAGLGYEALIVMGVGGFLLALPLGILSYYFSLPFFTQIQRTRMKKRVLS